MRRHLSKKIPSIFREFSKIISRLKPTTIAKIFLAKIEIAKQLTSKLKVDSKAPSQIQSKEKAPIPTQTPRQDQDHDPGKDKA